MKIGLGLITCNRPDFYAECLKSIAPVRDQLQSFVVVNDGGEIPLPERGGDIIPADIYKHNSKNEGVGKSKNHAFRLLLESGCEHIFLIEDDIRICSSSTFGAYIECAQRTGLQHLMYGYHGPANKIANKPNPRLVVDIKGTSVALNRHCVGAFTYYTRSILEEVGLNDEEFTNAWEHVEHSYRIVKAGGCPAYWWWPDVANSNELLSEQACSEDNSAIRPRSDWQENIRSGMEHFVHKHGFSPVAVPDTEDQYVLTNLKRIYENRSK